MAKDQGAMDKEKQTVRFMIEIYCADKHATANDGLCQDCSELLHYANQRLDKCPFAPDKPSCAQCKVHCYKPELRKKIQNVMRYSGPRMIKKHPLLAVRHLVRGLKGKGKK